MNNGKAHTGWRLIPLCEAAEVTMGSSPPGESYNDEGKGVPLINGPVEFSEGDFGLTIRGKSTTEPTRMCEAGDLLLCVRGSTTGRTNIAGFEACIGRGVASIRAKEDQRFLDHFIRTQRQRLFDLGNGSTFPSITQEQLISVKVPIPPVTEQRRIAAILDKADAIRQKREEGIRLTEELLRSTFLEMFGDPATNPKGWEIVPLGSAAELVTSGLTPTGGSTIYVDAGPLFIRSQNVRMNRLDLSDVAFLPQAIHESMSRTKVHEGDVLLNITGASIGRVAAVDTLPGEANVNQHVCIIRLDRKKATPEFVSVFISLSFGQRQIDNMQSGASRQGLNHQQVRSLRMPLPPLPLQQRYSRAVSVQRKLSDKREQGRMACDELFNALVQRAFRGEL